MMNLFSILLVPGTDGETLLSAEIIQDTNAVFMTYADAKAVGFNEVPEQDAHENVILIAVEKKDSGWIHRSLEGNENVVSYKIYDIG